MFSCETPPVAASEQIRGWFPLVRLKYSFLNSFEKRHNPVRRKDSHSLKKFYHTILREIFIDSHIKE